MKEFSCAVTPGPQCRNGGRGGNAAGAPRGRGAGTECMCRGAGYFTGPNPMISSMEPFRWAFGLKTALTGMPIAISSQSIPSR